jgi:hypothetical protein
MEPVNVTAGVRGLCASSSNVRCCPCRRRRRSGPHWSQYLSADPRASRRRRRLDPCVRRRDRRREIAHACGYTVPMIRAVLRSS